MSEHPFERFYELGAVVGCAVSKDMARRVWNAAIREAVGLAIQCSNSCQDKTSRGACYDLAAAMLALRYPPGAVERKE